MNVVLPPACWNQITFEMDSHGLRMEMNGDGDRDQCDSDVDRDHSNSYSDSDGDHGDNQDEVERLARGQQIGSVARTESLWNHRNGD